MRFDSVGLFWQDQAANRKRGEVVRMQPPIPETGWRPPKDFPNLSSCKALSFDLETYDPEFVDHGPGWARGKGHIVGGSIGTIDGHRWYFPMKHTIEPEMNMNPVHVSQFFTDTFESKQLQSLVGANLMYDLGWCRQEKIVTQQRIRQLELVDIQFAEALLDEDALVRLSVMAQKYLGERKQTDVVFKWCSEYYGGKPSADQRKNLWRAPPKLVGPYGESDADLPLRIASIIYERLRSEGLLELFRMECRLIPLLLDMRFAGVSVNLKKAEEVSDDLSRRATLEQEHLDSLIGFRVNVNSSDQLANAFDKLGIKYPRTPATVKNPDGKPSVVKDWLERLDHPVGNSIREIRRLEKLNGTFVKGYILGSNVKGKIFCSFHPLKGEDGGTGVGRFSSSDPNLQNVPVRDPELGKLIRSIFIPDEGHKSWIKFDYSQIQYRGLVHYAVGAGSEEARKRYREDPETDYHDWVQELVERIFHKKIERRPIKNINFGLSFGMGEPKLKRYIKANSDAEAKEFLKKYHQGVPFVKPTIEHFSQLAGYQGYLVSILGRKSRFNSWEPSHWDGRRYPALPYERALQVYGSIKRAFLHKALNRELQMFEADVMKASMLKCYEDGVYDVIGVPRLIVHDEFDHSKFDGPWVNEGFVEAKRILSETVKCSVPILVEVEEASNWGETS